jgi:hypothetical protein
MGRPARINPDSHGVLVVATSITAVLAAVSFALSYSGLVAVASWAAVPPWLSWAVPLTIDGAILVYTLAALVFRARGERSTLAWSALSLFTGLSMASNAAHAWTSGPGDGRAILGAVIAGLAPVAVLLTTHTIARLIIAPPAVQPVAQPEPEPEAQPVPAVRSTPARPKPARPAGTVDHARIRQLAQTDPALSHRAIAAQLGVSKTTVSRVLAGPPATGEALLSI